MSSAYPYPPSERPAEYKDTKDRPCSDCDVSDFDTSSCEVEGLAAQAEYLKTFQDKLTTRRTQFDAARTDYEKARADAAADLEAASKRLTELRKQLDCTLSPEERSCLSDAWDKVREQLLDCGDGSPCVSEGDCDFTWDSGAHPSAGDIAGKIKEFEGKVTRAEASFDNLVKEPAELKKRVTGLKTFVLQIGVSAPAAPAAGAAQAAPPPPDPQVSYASLLWAEYRLTTVWLGFGTADDYLDCLCEALNCSQKGRRALGSLTGMLATLECQQKKHDERCVWLLAHVVEQIVATCRRLCPPESAS